MSTETDATRPDPALAVVVLAAGQGTRMDVDHPKVLVEACGAPLLRYVLDRVASIRPSRTIVVVGHRGDEVRKAFASVPGLEFVVQDEPRGTGHAVDRCRTVLERFEGDVAVLYGDVPGLREETMRALIAHHRDAGAEATILAARASSPTGYGRVLRGEDGGFVGVVEESEATPEQRAIHEINVGPCVVRSATVWERVATLPERGPKRERYLTEAFTRLARDGRRVVVHAMDDADEGLGVNSLADLAEVGRVLQRQILEEHLANGVRIVDPRTTYVDRTVRIGSGTVLHPCTVIEGEVEIGRGCEVGPFTHLRTGVRLEDSAEVGNFTEMKKSVLGRGSKAKHLTYLGDAVVGERVNVGAGTITANYDGKSKYVTRVADGAFLGSGTILVAPVELGARSVTGAGAVVVKHTPVGADEVFVGVPARRLETGDATGRAESRETTERKRR